MKGGSERHPNRTTMTDCPCGSGRAYDDCCGPLIAGAPAPTPEALMRSRYTAYVRREFDHIERTQVPGDFDRAEAEKAADAVEWLGLDVRKTVIDGDTGTVEFAARFRHTGREALHHELSRFRLEDGGWLYVDGDLNPKQPPRRVEKIGRNDPCPCGSGKKHKKCCGA